VNKMNVEELLDFLGILLDQGWIEYYVGSSQPSRWRKEQFECLNCLGVIDSPVPLPGGCTVKIRRKTKAEALKRLLEVALLEVR